MKNDASKATRERRVFHDFIQRSGSAIDPKSVESRLPPEPDILCRHQDEGLIAFELVEICDPTIAKALSSSRREGGVQFLRGADPSADTLSAKLAKRYKTKNPIELLCYTAGRAISPDAIIIEEIRGTLETQKCSFRRVWLSGDQCHLVWDS